MKKLLLIFMLFLFASFVSAVSLDDEDLLGYWKMDEASGGLIDFSDNDLLQFTMELSGGAPDYQQTALTSYSDFSINFKESEWFSNNSIDTYYGYTNITVCAWLDDEDLAHGTSRYALGNRESGPSRGFTLRHFDGGGSNTCMYWDSAIEITADIDFWGGVFCCKINDTHLLG